MLMLEYHTHYQSGFLPFPGSISDQPNNVIQAITTITRRVMHNQQEQSKRAKKARR